MKKILLVSLYVGIFLLFNYFLSFAHDPGHPDTVRFLPWGTYVTCPPSTGTAIVPMVVVNDESLTIMQIPIEWTGDLRVDSGIFVGERSNYMTNKLFLADNDLKRVGIIVYVVDGEEAIPPGEGILMYLYFTVQDTGFVTLDTFTSPIPEGFSFYSPDGDYIVPYFSPSEFHITKGSTLPGDLNQDSRNTISDIVFLINYLFKGGPAPAYLASGDANTDCKVNLSDVVYFINYLFKNGPRPWMGCEYP
jgi:hypothetical protein